VNFSGGAVTIVGAGPTGALLAILLRRRGLAVTLYESRPDPGDGRAGAGRSINLALADRGIHALKLAGVFETIAGMMTPMRGRFIHPRDGSPSLQPYGQRPSEVIYSISRQRLNQALLDVAVQRHGVEVNFEHRLESADFQAGEAHVRDLRGDRLLRVPMHPLLASDGAGSVMRRCMTALGLIEAGEEALEHGYKELTIPAGLGGSHRLAADALHIWPRGNFMLIALPNTDGSFTATLFLPKRGPSSFDSLSSAESIERFMSDSFPDVRELMPGCVAEFQDHSTGSLGTVYANTWHFQGMAALIGDSAHAIVPFHGQGMNCCFEDCVELAACMDRHATWAAVFAEFGAVRKPDTDAIAAMALENYLEMRERVVDPQFRLQQTLALELERRHPQRFIPRYSMVMFHHEISYRAALQRGLIQARLLAELTAGAATLADIDFHYAAREIELKLAPVSPDASAVQSLSNVTKL
jgi:kynurenine 3-monooxygenase